MSKFKLLHYSDRRLKLRAQPVVLFDDNFKSLVALMIEALERNHLNSLCAGQIGIPEKIIILKDEANQPIVLINPEIVKSEGEIVLEEECNLFPHIVFNTSRKDNLLLTYNDIHGGVVEAKFSGMHAGMIQQYLDQFQGKLLIDNMSNLKKERFLKKYEEMLAHHACHHGCAH